jgi:hypothetical protein
MHPSDRPTSKSVTKGSAAAPQLLTWSLWLVLGLTFVAQIVGIVRRNVNWDEFLFLTTVHRSVRGESIQVLQTAYVHLFGWLSTVGGTELDQIVAARSFYLLLWALSLSLLYRLGRRVLDPFGALAAVVLFASFSYSIVHAVSFRIDGLLLPVLVGHVLLLSDPTPKRVVGAGALFGVAVVLSIKAALWAPLSGLLLLWWIREKRTTWTLAIGSVVTGLLAAGVLFFLHWALTSTPTEVTAAVASTGLAANQLKGLAPTFSYMFLEQGLVPRSAFILQAAMTNLITVSLLIVGAVLAIGDIRSRERRTAGVVLLILALPILSVAFYANAWPYAYVTLIPTACLLSGYTASRLSRLRHPILLVFVVGATAPVIANLWALREDGQEAQRQVLSLVHQTFKSPVPYIDRTGMIPSFPRAASNLTQFGLSLYNQRGVPQIANDIAALHPPLLIINTPVLDVWQDIAPGPGLRLLPQDEAALRATYAPYWGAIYLAGREWRDVSAGQRLDFEIVIPGEYTLVSDVPATIDGEPHHAGATVTLSKGPHTLQTDDATGRLRLLWGRGLKIPTIEPSSQPIFAGF